MKRWVALLCGCLASINISAGKYIIGAQSLAYFPHYDFSSTVDKGVAWSILDFVYPDNRGWYNSITTSKEKYFSAPITRALTGTIVKRENAGQGIDNIKHLAMPLGFTPVNWQVRIDNQSTDITWVKDIQQGLTLVYQERVDALDLEYFVNKHSAPYYFEQDAFVLDLTLPHNDIPFSLSTLYPQDIITALNDFMSSNPELIANIKAKYEMTDTERLFQQLLEQQGLEIEEVWK